MTPQRPAVCSPVGQFLYDWHSSTLVMDWGIRLHRQPQNSGGLPSYLRIMTLEPSSAIYTMSRYFVCSSDEEELNEQYELQLASSSQSDANLNVGGGVAESCDLQSVSARSVPDVDSSEPACVCRCFGTPHGPTCYVTRGGVRALVEATAGIFSEHTGRSTRTRVILGALGATILGAAAGAVTYYSLTTSGGTDSLSESGREALDEAVAQVSLNDLPIVHPGSASPPSVDGSEVSAWNNQYD